MILCVKQPLQYEKRLRKLKLPTLSYRRVRGDMIDLYKYVIGKYVTSLNFNFRSTTVSAMDTRGNMYKMVPVRCRYDLRKNFFLNRAVPIWNSLPDSVVSAGSVDVFKSRLDSFWSMHDFVYDYRASPPLGAGSR